jgi:hypothetical protein
MVHRNTAGAAAAIVMKLDESIVCRLAMLVAWISQLSKRAQAA